MPWLVVDNEDSVDVLPDYGRDHEPGPACWCAPRTETHEKLLVIHESEQ